MKHKGGIREGDEAGTDYLLRTYQHLNNEFYRNGENRWKYFTTITGFLSVLLVALQLFPDGSVFFLPALMVTSLGGLLVFVSIYRIIVAIDRITCAMFEKLLQKIVGSAEAKRFAYPEPTQFLRGYSYVFSIHNALAAVFAGFLSASSTILVSSHLNFPAAAYVAIGFLLWLALLVVTWKVSNVGFHG